MDSVPSLDGEAGTPDALDHLVEGVRSVQLLVTTSNPPPEIALKATEGLADVCEQLRPWVVDEVDRVAGRRWERPGRGQVFAPPVHFGAMTVDSIEATFVLTRTYIGDGDAAHGGALPLVLDEVLGHLANAYDRPQAKTAYLTVNYRVGAPVDTTLTVRGKLVDEAGRKRLIRGTVHHGTALLADAEALFVVPAADLPGP